MNPNTKPKNTDPNSKSELLNKVLKLAKKKYEARIVKKDSDQADSILNNL